MENYTIMSIRFGLQRFFQSSAKYDIINDPEFKLSNGAYGLGQVRPPQALGLGTFFYHIVLQSLKGVI